MCVDGGKKILKVLIGGLLPLWHALIIWRLHPNPKDLPTSSILMLYVGNAVGIGLGDSGHCNIILYLAMVL